jgi:hypothetical protein
MSYKISTIAILIAAAVQLATPTHTTLTSDIQAYPGAQFRIQ